MRLWNASKALGGALIVIAAMTATVAAQRGETTSPQRGTSPQPRTEMQRGGATTGQTEVCPADIQGLQVQAANTQEGGALVFTTTPANVSQLRERLTRFVRMHEQMMSQSGGGAAGATGGAMQPGTSPGTTGGTARGTTPGAGTSPGATGGTARGTTGAGAPGTRGTTPGMAGGGAMPRFADMQALIHQGHVETVEIPNGVLLLVELPSPERVNDLRNELRQDAQALSQGRCPLSLQVESA